MPQFADLTVQMVTGTDVVFKPNTLVGLAANYVDRSGGVSIGFPSVTVNVTPPSKTSRLNKVRVKCVIPVLETLGTATLDGINPAPTKAYDMTATAEFFLPERSTLAQRQAIRSLMKTVLGNALAVAVIETQETVY